ncbi:single-stranded DNA-binding protein [Neolewinella antarctica]|uniref:Single-stranded DNA-binding protein n=1 Tax=Neolewinella antarctica TaxID=442734 RepID=A0ABX0X8W8_9BACT|nr:single-stranded DNA-binding protein [Neolewinella antarctica]NJC25247.1 single-strand DNA-binding protein [Neolewinella antarctica]
MSIRNSVSLIGNLGKAPQVTVLDSGTKITEFSLATNEYFRDREGNRQTRTMWHTVKSFGKTAEILGEYLSSGSQVAIDGRLSYRKWIDRHDQVRITTEIIVEDFTFLSPKGQTNDAAATSAAEAAEVEITNDRMERGASSQIAAEPAPKMGKKPSRKSATTRKKSAGAKARASLTALIDDVDLPF